ncbi:MAG: o-succinylbenzoate synthase [Bacteroidota bacterium]
MQSLVQQRSLALRRPFRTSGWVLTQRDILLFSLHDHERGLSGWGESAPLPSFGTEKYSDSHHALEAAVLAFSRLKEIPSRGLPDIDALIPALRDAPAARYAVECALLDLQSRMNGVSMAETLGGIQQPRIAVNITIGAGSAAEAAAAAETAWREGYSCLKLKVGKGTLEEDVERIRAVRLAVPENMLLRLDANGAYDFEQAEAALREFAMYDIDYIEQPVPVGADDELAALTGLRIISIAADESAQNLTQARRLLERRAVDLFVVKPMAAGGLIDCRRFALEAAGQGCDVVFTSLIDSSVGRQAAAQLCASLPDSPRHHGLATGALFLEDTHRDDIAQGCFILPEGAGLGFTLPHPADSEESEDA